MHLHVQLKQAQTVINKNDQKPLGNIHAKTIYNETVFFQAPDTNVANSITAIST